MIGRMAFALSLSFVAVPTLAASDLGGCTALAKIKAQLADGTTLTALTPGQWNFLRGFYLGAPPTLQGTIPGSGAMLLERKGAKDGVIVWTRGKLACQPFPVPAAFVDALKGSKTGPLAADGTEL